MKWKGAIAQPSKSQRVRRTLVLEMLGRVEALQTELQTCTIERNATILTELDQLRRNQNLLSLTGKRKKNVAKLPQSFLERQKAARVASARLSGRDKIAARFVQGGAPGSGGRSK